MINWIFNEIAMYMSKKQRCLYCFWTINLKRVTWICLMIYVWLFWLTEIDSVLGLSITPLLVKYEYMQIS